MIPFAAESIRVRLVRDGALLGESVLTRPVNGGSASATFDRLPPGTIQAQASAYPTTTGDGVAQASATVSVVIQAGQTTPTHLTLQSTIDRIEITPALSALTVGQQVTLAATARNAGGDVVLTSGATLQWSSNAPGVVSADAGGLIKGIANGQGVVTVVDTESGKSASLTLSVGSSTPQPTTQNLPVNDMVYSPVTGKIYASVGSSSANGNSIATIDPVSGLVEKTTFIGSEPGNLAVSDDGRYVYVGLQGASLVCRYNIAQNKKDQEFSLGSDGFLGAYYAEQIAVMPGNAETIAVSRRNQGFSPRHQGVAIFDNGVIRPVTTPGHTGANQIEWATPTRIYDDNNETTGFGFYRLTVDASGVTVQDVDDSFQSDLIAGFGVQLDYDTGKIVTTSGRIVDAENRLLLGTVAGRGPVAPDIARNRVFFTSSTSGTVSVDAYDATTFLRVATVPVPGVVGSVTRLVRWGDKGLAFSTDQGKIYFIPQAPGL